MKKIIEKRKRCIPLKNLKSEQNETTDLIKYVSDFDLSPKTNFEILQNNEIYKKYLYKYKYTLYYEDAKKLGCFNEVDERNLIKSINAHLESLNIKDKNINESKIYSLSKTKLIDFLLYLLNLNPSKKDFQGIIEYIDKLKLEIIFIYKAPIEFGNYELQYYFYYELFIEFFLYNTKSKKKSKTETQSFPSMELDYFPNINNNRDLYEVDLTEFEIRRQKLLVYIEENKKNEEQLTKDIKELNNQEKKKTEIIELDENIENKEKTNNNINEKKQNEKIINDSYKTFVKKLQYFRKFKELIINIFFPYKREKEEEILKKIKYLYFYILFEIKTYKPPDIKLLNSFYIKNNDEDIKYIKNYENNIHNLFNGDYNKILIKNIDFPEYFFENIENPFIDNYLSFPFPTIFHKSFLEYDNEIYKDFLDFLTFIYQSPLLTDIYYLCPEFSDFEYPFKNTDILKEMFENTYFIPCESEKLYGYTQKNLISIFIPAIISNEKSNRLERFIIRLSFILNAIIHEQLKHYMKALIFYNSFRYGENKHIESDEDLDNNENEYLKGIMIKKRKNKDLSGKDGGHRTEIFLYGEVLERLTSLQGLKMFYKSTWQTSIDEHLSQFKNNYKSELKDESSNYLMNYLKLDKISTDDDVCPFFKKILKKFIDFKKIKKSEIYIDIDFTSKKEPNEETEGNELYINLNYEEYFDRENFRDYNP